MSDENKEFINNWINTVYQNLTSEDKTNLSHQYKTLSSLDHEERKAK